MKILETYTELHRNILDVFNEYSVQIMTPAYMKRPGHPKVGCQAEPVVLGAAAHVGPGLGVRQSAAARLSRARRPADRRPCRFARRRDAQGGTPPLRTPRAEFAGNAHVHAAQRRVTLARHG